MREVEQRAIQADKNLSRIMTQTGRSMTESLRSSLAGIAPTLAAAFSVQQVIRYADSYTSLQNRLRAAGLEGERMVMIEDALYAAASRNGVAVEAVAALYQRASLSRDSLQASDEQLIALTNGVTAALRVQGVTAQEASGPLLQLGQALGAGTVRAEELNSLLEGVPVILQAAARGSEKYAGDTNKLATAIREGEVTSREFFQALLTGLPALESQASTMQMTVGGAFQALNDALGRYVGQSDQSLSATARLAQGIEMLARNLDTIIPVATALLSVIGVRYAYALAVSTGALATNAIATARLTAFNIAMTASMTGATRAQVALNLAMSANPVVRILTVVTALTAGLLLLAQRTSQAAVASKELGEATDRGNTALANYEKAQIAARDASKENAKAARESAAAMREEAVAAIQATQALIAKRGAEARDAVERATADAREANRAFTGGGTSEGSRAIQFGAQRRAVQAQEAMNRAQARAGEVIREQIRQQQELDRITRGVNLGGAGSGGGGTEKKDKDGGKGKTGPTPQELADTREMLRLQGQLELLQAQGREDEARNIQRQIDLINLTKRYEDAKMVNAADQAKAQIDQIAAIEDANREIDKMLEGRRRQLDRNADAQQRENDLMIDRLGYEAELARLSGDPRRIEAAERELFIEERINEILRLRPELTKQAARAQAEDEAGALKSAGASGEMREEFRRSFRDGIHAAIEGDMGGLFESLADRFTSRMLDNLADDLFDLISGSMKGSGGGWMSALLSGFGKRASGGPVMAGQPYIVGERRPEVFVPNVNGTVIPSVNAAMARAGKAQAGRSQAVAVRIDVNDDRFNAYVDGRAAPMAIRSTATGVAYSQDQMQAATRRRRQSLVG